MKNKKTNGTKKINSKTLVIGIIVLVLLLLTCFKVYVDNDYKPQNNRDYFGHEAELSVSVEDNMISVTPVTKKEERVGLIIYGGERINRECYFPLMIKLAIKGYDCFYPTTFGNLPFLNQEGAEFVIRKNPDIKKWYIIAHSQSCEVAAEYAQKNKGKLTGIIYLGGYSRRHDLSDTGLQFLSIHGSRDTVFNLDIFNNAKKNDPAGGDYRVINGGNNSNFADCGLLKRDSEASIDLYQQMDETAEIIDEFIISSKDEK